MDSESIHNPLALAASVGDARSVRTILEKMKSGLTMPQIDGALKKAQGAEVIQLLRSAREGLFDAKLLSKKPGKMPTYGDVAALVEKTKKGAQGVPKALQERAPAKVKGATERFVPDFMIDDDESYEIGDSFGTFESTDGTGWEAYFRNNKIDPAIGFSVVDLVLQTQNAKKVEDLDNFYEESPEDIPWPLWFIRHSQTFPETIQLKYYTFVVYDPEKHVYVKYILALHRLTGKYTLVDYPSMESRTEPDSLRDTLLRASPLDTASFIAFLM